MEGVRHPLVYQAPMEDEPRLTAPVSPMEEQVVLKIHTCTIEQDAPGSELLGVKELQVQLTCGDLIIETPWKTSGSNFLFEEKLALPENELEFMIFGRGGTQGDVGVPVARALEKRDGKLTECDKSTSDKMDPEGQRKKSKCVELKLVPLGEATAPSLGTLVIFLNAPKGSQPAPTASATAQPATGSDAGYGGAGGGGPLLQAVPEAGPPTGGGAGGATGGAGMEGWEAAAQAADKAADEAQHEQSLPELSSLFAELHKLRSDLKKEQRVLEHRAHECNEAEEALDSAREQVLEKSVLLEEVKTLRLNAVDEDRRRLRQVASSK